MTAHVARTDDLAACHRIRAEVFTTEQGIPEADDLDGLDGDAVQVLLTIDGTPIGTARMLTDGATGKIGRVAVLKPHRGQGHGQRLVQALILQAQALGLSRVELGSRVDATGFYERLGFTATGEPFLDVGIPHQMMVRDL